MNRSWLLRKFKFVMDPFNKSHAIRKLLLFSRAAQHYNYEVTFKKSHKTLSACLAVANISTNASFVK
jgi:hypothetical protein